MTRIWLEEEMGGGDGWVADPLGADRGSDEPPGVRLLRCRDGEGWVLVPDAAQRVLVNGRPVPPVRLLDDRDEIRTSRGRFFYSTERLAAIEPFAGPEGAPCGLCKKPIAAASASVTCPGCGVAYHEVEGRTADDELRCWTHRATCIVCGHPTALDGAFRWSPQDL